ncbi:hypothetical protein K438DRAFT_282038 [Mycena galopus ATCC 62051]|nr:hypothetical protein K438DRAFT_282038 [Mycena galopus ATCC 62051]
MAGGTPLSHHDGHARMWLRKVEFSGAPHFTSKSSDCLLRLFFSIQCSSCLPSRSASKFFLPRQPPPSATSPCPRTPPPPSCAQSDPRTVPPPSYAQAGGCTAILIAQATRATAGRPSPARGDITGVHPLEGVAVRTMRASKEASRLRWKMSSESSWSHATRWSRVARMIPEMTAGCGVRRSSGGLYIVGRSAPVRIAPAHSWYACSVLSKYVQMEGKTHTTSSASALCRDETDNERSRNGTFWSPSDAFLNASSHWGHHSQSSALCAQQTNLYLLGSSCMPVFSQKLLHKDTDLLLNLMQESEQPHERTERRENEHCRWSAIVRMQWMGKLKGQHATHAAKGMD